MWKRSKSRQPFETVLHADHLLSEFEDMAFDPSPYAYAAYYVIIWHAMELRLFSTTEGFLGLGPRSIQLGDSVWIVPGSPLPLVFRSSQLEGRYRLVGGAFVHGFMAGEAV